MGCSNRRTLTAVCSLSGSFLLFQEKWFYLCLCAHSDVENVRITAEECRGDEGHAGAGQSVGCRRIDAGDVSRNDEGDSF